VIGAISTDASRIFSYSYPRLAATQRAAGEVLAGRAAAQYRELFPFLRNAGAQQLTVRTRVVRVGVTWLTATDARLLVFLNQTASRGRGKPSSVPAQLAITAQYRAGRWRITGIGAR
jgi:Mce-associated membrane protein